MTDDEEARRPNNAQLFQVAVSNSLKGISQSVSEDEFVKIHTILKSEPKNARKLYKAMVKELYTSMNNDLKDILNEGSLQDAFVKVAKLSEEYPSITSVNEDTWRPPGDTISHMRSLDAHTMKESIAESQERVTRMESENETLMRTIAEMRSKISASHDGVTKSLKHGSDILQELQKTCVQLANGLKTIESE